MFRGKFDCYVLCMIWGKHAGAALGVAFEGVGLGALRDSQALTSIGSTLTVHSRDETSMSDELRWGQLYGFRTTNESQPHINIWLRVAHEWMDDNFRNSSCSFRRAFRISIITDLWNWLNKNYTKQLNLTGYLYRVPIRSIADQDNDRTAIISADVASVCVSIEGK